MSNIKSKILGMPYGTAAARLLKIILFDLVVKTEQDRCFHCGERITSSQEMSIEHKEPWQYHSTPTVAFFSIENIAFSHRTCNYRAAIRTNAKHRTPDQIREMWAEAKRRNYTSEKRHRKWMTKKQ